MMCCHAGSALSKVERDRLYLRFKSRTLPEPCKGVVSMFYRAGLAFSEVERDRLYLRGLLPPAILSQTVQAERVMINIRAKASDMDRHSYLTSLQVHVKRVMWRMLSSHTLHAKQRKLQPMSSQVVITRIPVLATRYNICRCVGGCLVMWVASMNSHCMQCSGLVIAHSALHMAGPQ